MSDRLIICNPETKQYCIIAKDFGSGFKLGNVDNLETILWNSHSFEKLFLADWDSFDVDGWEDINKENSWKEYWVTKI